MLGNLVPFELVETENILQQFVDFRVSFLCHCFLLLVLSEFLRYFAICFEKLRYCQREISPNQQRQSYSISPISRKNFLRKK